MRSSVAEAFPSLEALTGELTRWCATYPYLVEPHDSAEHVVLPHRPVLKLPIPRRRFSLKRKRLGAGYEQVATAAFDFVCEHSGFETFYDLGAGWGYFGFLASARQDRAIESHCFDMHPASIDLIRKLADEHGLDRLHAYLSGMSDRYLGERQVWYSITKMFEQKPDPASYRDPLLWRLKFWLRGRRDRDQLRSETVVIDSIDSFGERNGLTPGLLKIDVDGYEAKVIPGGMATFRRDRPVIFLELHKSRFFAHHGVTRPEIVAPLFDLGYSCLLTTNHHNLARNRFVPVDRHAPELSREETDFLIFV